MIRMIVKIHSPQQTCQLERLLWLWEKILRIRISLLRL